MTISDISDLNEVTISDEIILQTTCYEVYKMQPNEKRWPRYAIEWRVGDNWVLKQDEKVYNFEQECWIDRYNRDGEDDRDACYRPFLVCYEKAKELLFDEALVDLEVVPPYPWELEITEANSVHATVICKEA